MRGSMPSGRETNEATGDSKPPEVTANALVVTRELTKRYGDFVALDRCSLAVQKGEVFGLLGPNGAGKTTLLRLMLGFVFPSAGSAWIGGIDVAKDSVAVRRLVSYLPGDARLPRHMRGTKVLEFFAEMQPDGDLERSRSVADRLELDLRRRVAFMSTGMRQKLALAVVLGARTPLLILDEPTANLDPSVRSSILEMVREAQSEGRTIILSSHVLAEIEEVCSRVIFLRHGVLALQQRLEDLKQRHRIIARLPAGDWQGLCSRVPANLDSAVEVGAWPSPVGEARGRPDQAWVRIDTAGDLAPLLQWLAGLQLERMRVEPLGLRAIYNEVHHPQHRQGRDDAGSDPAGIATPEEASL